MFTAYHLQLFLLGLVKTRKAVASMSNAPAPDGAPNVWSPPEALEADMMTKGVAEGSQKHADETEAGMAAEAFAFGMIAWEVSGGKR